VVHRLVDAGLVDRHPDPRDRRRVRLTLTGRGRALLRRCPDSAQQQLVRAIEELSARERRAFAGSLGRIVAGMAEATPVLFFEREDGGQGRRRRA
ncbi:MAG TPA: MarR family transcriptional regulator, partial [Thermoanaerobaculia bacterium]|nr:MarR family transcriptional regulator [Thermoanaerobaculia bacterium]